jgi:hypothetical protein
MGVGNHYQLASAEESRKTAIAGRSTPTLPDCQPGLVFWQPERHFSAGLAGLVGLPGFGVQLSSLVVENRSQGVDEWFGRGVPLAERAEPLCSAATGLPAGGPAVRRAPLIEPA